MVPHSSRPFRLQAEIVGDKLRSRMTVVKPDDLPPEPKKAKVRTRSALVTESGRRRIVKVGS